jgi:hypothetical protein
MDMDWANDGVLADTIALAERLDVPVCMFVTHNTPMLTVLRAHPLFTLGIHPNFLPQLNGQTTKTYRETIEEMLAFVPEAKIIRCHALVDATPILMMAKELGFKADMNLFIPFSSGIRLSPFRHFSGLVRLPFFYEDDAWALEPGHSSPEQHLSGDDPGLRIFNFHPIHLYLNMEDMDRYNRAKPYYHDFENLAGFVNQGQGFGARDFLLRIKETADRDGIRFGKVEELWN